MAKIETISSPKAKKALTFWHGVNTIALKRMPLDLTARQISILLHVYLNNDTHTVKKLSETLTMPKSAVCRAIDVLESAKLLKRISDKNDKRNVLINKTAKGTQYVNSFADIIMLASKAAA